MFPARADRNDGLIQIFGGESFDDGALKRDGRCGWNLPGSHRTGMQDRRL